MLSHLVLFTSVALTLTCQLSFSTEELKKQQQESQSQDESISWLFQAQQAKKLIKTQNILLDPLASKRKYNHCISALYHSTHAAQLHHPFATKELDQVAESLASHKERKAFLKACKKSHLLKNTISKQHAIDYVRGLAIIEDGLLSLQAKKNEHATPRIENRIMRGLKLVKVNEPAFENTNRIVHSKLKRLEQIAQTRKLGFTPNFIENIDKIFEKVKNQ